MHISGNLQFLKTQKETATTFYFLYFGNREGACSSFPISLFLRKKLKKTLEEGKNSHAYRLAELI